MVSSSQLRLVVGLGNPGEKYARNRHNLGAMTVDELAKRVGLTKYTLAAKPQVLIASAHVGIAPGGVPGPLTVLAKPTAYMNLSGGPVKAVANRFEIPPDRVVVVHDDLDLPFGVVRLKLGGGEGGHNGLRDITRALGTRDYLRVRLGIGRPPERVDPAAYVLGDFPPAVRQSAEQLVERGANAVELLILNGLEQAQARFHGPDPSDSAT